LSNVISKEPLGPVVRQGDDKWFNIVRWTLNAMITAEELGVTSKTVDKPSQNSEINRLLGNTDLLGERLGLDKKWSYNIIKQRPVSKFDLVWAMVSVIEVLYLKPFSLA
jgi:general L-amino acid transport system substrate-binding protein